jgi:tripartite-type tricarboxylate transporter receptor subunit TctC
VVIPVEAGGDADISTRFWMKKASTLLTVPMVAVNKPGAGLTLGYRDVYQAKPDGYTVGIANATVITAKMQGFFPYDYKGFTLLGHVSPSFPLLLASTKTKRPFKSINEIIASAKSRPGEVTLATTAVGGIYWSAGLLLGLDLGLDFNLVPQEGSAAFVITQLAGGHMDLGVAGAFAAKPQIEAGNIHAIATFGNERLPGSLSNVPTLKELGYPIVLNSFGTVIGPPKIPPQISEILVKAFKESIVDPEFDQFVLSRSERPGYMSPEDFLKLCEEQKAAYQRIYSKAGILKTK